MYDSDLFLFKGLFYAIYIKVSLMMSPFQIGVLQFQVVPNMTLGRYPKMGHGFLSYFSSI